MASSQIIRRASRLLHSGGVIAYPTEGVFGLGCLPNNATAVYKILEMKGRDVSKGLILIASDARQLDDWIDLGDADIPSTESNPTTWIVPATDAAPSWIRGAHETVAVRLTTHPIARALCEEAASCIVSTSANLSGHAPARNATVLRRQFGPLVDYVVPGQCGPARGASEIRDIRTNRIVRPA
jgi:L-threonylcarbamoyladenylate synthase